MTSSADSGPGNLHFPLHPDEKVLSIAHRHWLYLYPRLLFILLEAVVPVVVLGVILSSTGGLEGTGSKIFAGLTLLWLLFWSIRAFLAWYKYANDIWVITDQRIVDSLKTSPFSLKLSTADLVNVLDMTVEQRGVLQTMLNYGDIVCQTAADLQEFRLVGIPHPREVQALVDRERDRERQRASGLSPRPQEL
jgi:hypothetical protein